MQKPDYYMHLDLPVYGKVGMIEGKGIHYFSAMTKAKGDPGLLFKFLILELLVVDGKSVNEKFIDEMQIKDVCYLTTVIGTMMEQTSF